MIKHILLYITSNMTYAYEKTKVKQKTLLLPQLVIHRTTNGFLLRTITCFIKTGDELQPLQNNLVTAITFQPVH